MGHEIVGLVTEALNGEDEGQQSQIARFQYHGVHGQLRQQRLEVLSLRSTECVGSLGTKLGDTGGAMGDGESPPLKLPLKVTDLRSAARDRVDNLLHTYLLDS